MTQATLQAVAAADLPERGQPLAGGTFVTRYWLNGQERALVLLSDEISGTWGKYGEEVTGAVSYSDGERLGMTVVNAHDLLLMEAV
ncbi:hypothetical protein [Pseudomonas gingeri]|uniref:hypothetical protein n=1 Tax=Pseudomonas gingeri TaxID=117681 RepID=UPI00210C7F04|nr:hypothetical protein [Pseudomonas gingeri]